MPCAFMLRHLNPTKPNSMAIPTVKKANLGTSLPSPFKQSDRLPCSKLGVNLPHSLPFKQPALGKGRGERKSRAAYLRWWPHSSGLWLVYDLCLNSRRMRRLSCLCPHCRTVCHCSRPSCRRHARLLPGHCIAGAHLPGGGAEESGQDRTLSCTCPFQGPIWAWGSAVLCDRRGGTRSAPGTPEGGEPAPEQPPELSDSALRASGSSAKHSPRPGAAPRLAAPPPWGPHAPPRSPAVRAEPRLPQAVRLLGLRLRPAPPCVRGFPGEGAAATCCGAPSEQRLVARPPCTLR